MSAATISAHRDLVDSRACEASVDHGAPMRRVNLFGLAGAVSMFSSCVTSALLESTRPSESRAPQVKSILGATAAQDLVRVGVEDDRGTRSVYVVNLAESSSLAMRQCGWDSNAGASTFRETLSRRIELPDTHEVLEPRSGPELAGELTPAAAEEAAKPFHSRSPISIRNKHGHIELRDLSHPGATREYALEPSFDSESGTDVVTRILFFPLTLALDVITAPFQWIYSQFLYPD